MPQRTERTLSQWLEHIEQLHPRGIDMGLARVADVADRLRVRVPAPLCFVVGGTNGKGTTTTAIEQILLAQGLQTGATFSPHFHRFNERIRVNGQEVSDTLLCDAFAAIERARLEPASAVISLSYFEFSMLAAFWCFLQCRVDAAVIEVGLGGRYDAANIIDADVAVITTIGLDHMDYLGPDRESIAFDKAHIARQGRPLVVGEPMPPASLLAVAQRIGARVILRGDGPGRFSLNATTSGFVFQGVAMRRTCVLDTELMLENVATALAALEAAGRLPDEAVLARGLAGARIAGRMQRVDAGRASAHSVPVYLDVGANPHAAAFLCTELAQAQRVVPGQTHVVIGVLADKDWQGVLQALGLVADHWYLAGTRGPRGVPSALLVDALTALPAEQVGDNRVARSLDMLGGADVFSGYKVAGGYKVVGGFENAELALRAALDRAVAGDRIVVTGCFQVVGDAMVLLGVPPPDRVLPG